MKVMLRNRMIMMLFLMLCTAMTFAQRNITGTVSDQTGEPLIGANIIVPGTTNGTITDIDGKFNLTIAADIAEIVVSYIGYTKQTIAISAANDYMITMQEGNALDEVVVIGYGEVKREDLTGAVQTLGSDNFNQGAIASPDQLLIGRVPGVQVTTDGGAPGSASNIRIRGASSINSNQSPLIIVDGLPLSEEKVAGLRNPLNAVNQNDIETFTVLKDASATAIYGSRASGGVILITTKSGKSGGDLQVDYNGNVSFGTLPTSRRLETFDATEYKALITERYGEGSAQSDLLGEASTDWQDEVFQTAIGTDHNLAFSGGLEGLPYRFSVGYTNQDGIIKTDKLRRVTGALSLTPSFFDNHLQFNINGRMSSANNNFADKDGAISNAITYDPTQPVYVDNNGVQTFHAWLDNNGNKIPVANSNPLAILEQKSDRGRNNRFLGNIETDYRLPFWKDMRLHLNLGYDNARAYGVKTTQADALFQTDTDGRYETYSEEQTSRLLEFYMNYAKDFNFLNSRFDLLGGYSWQSFYKENVTDNIYDFEKNNFLEAGRIDAKEYYLLSFFGRLNYAIEDKYILTGTLRQDGSSRFNEDNRWGLFPSFAFAWRIGQETFLKNSKAVSDLKLRAGWGVTGQQAVSDNYYPSQALYSSSQPTADYQLGNKFYNTNRASAYDSGLKWETTQTTNIGLDYGFINERIYGAIDFYWRKTEDLILNVRPPAGGNLGNEITSNVGTLKNNGIEASVNFALIQKESVTWDFGINATANTNEIESISTNDDPDAFIQYGGISGGVGNTIQAYKAGYPINSFFVYEQVYDANGNPLEGIYKDQNGDGEITASDLKVYKDANPDLQLGFNTSVYAGAFDFGLGARTSIGNHNYNNTESNYAAYSRLFGSAGYLANTTTDVTDTNFENNEFFSDYYVQDASFFRVDYVSVGYNFKNMIKNTRGTRLSFTAQNPLLITKYKGLDPEIFNGIDNNIYPRPTTYVVGLTINL